MRVRYLVADYDQPSWGTAMLYEHVHLLRDIGFDARVLHHRSPFRLSWVDHQIPIEHLDTLAEPPAEDDLLVVPETLAAAASRLGWRCRKVVFVQGSFLVAAGLEGADGYRELGYDHALAVLPHVAEVLRRHFEIEPEVVPPFVAPYFFRDPEELRTRERQRTILLSVKPGYRAVGFPDYDLFVTLLRRHLAAGGRRAGWRVEELVGLRHREVAERMASSSYLVCLNSHEAFNSVVPEAMAAGCLPVCYDAYGGRDYLVDGRNAFVFPNHHVFPLVEKLLELIDGDGDGERAAALAVMRANARATAERFTREATRTALQKAFANLTVAAARPA